MNALLCLLSMLPQAPAEAIVQLPKGSLVTGHMAVDVDGDGRLDLAIASRAAATGDRFVQVHLRRAEEPAFVSQPAWPPLRVERTVVAFTFCDCHPDPGRELVLLSPERAVRVRPRPGQEAEYASLCAHRLVWPAADPDGVAPLADAAIDFDGDGREDLLLPQPDGWTCWLQDDGAFSQRVERALPRWRNAFLAKAQGGALRADSRSFELSFGSGGPGRSALVSTAARTAGCAVVDLDGDGRRDLAMHRNGRFFGAVQTAPRALALREQDLPLPEDRLKLVDPAFDVQFEDVDGDGRADLLLTTSAQRDDEVEARVAWFSAAPDGAWPTDPTGQLRLQALAAPITLVDVDGDGRRDLVCVSVRTSAMKQLTADKATALDAQLTVFAGDGAGFARPAALNRAVPLFAGAERLAQPFARVRRGAVLLRVKGALERRPLEAREGRLRMLDADAAVRLADDERVLPFGDDDGEVLLVAEHEVRHVRFR